jgi:hypothetical protein
VFVHPALTLKRDGDSFTAVVFVPLLNDPLLPSDSLRGYIKAMRCKMAENVAKFTSYLLRGTKIA